MAIIFRYRQPGEETPPVLVAGGFDTDCSAYRTKLLEELAAAAGLSFDRGNPRNLLDKEEGGKPFAILGEDHYPVSVSHAGGFVVMALSPGPQIGIDTEKKQRSVADALRNRIQHRAEDGIPADNDIPTLELWTLKEAFLKMSGTGLRHPMDEVVIEPCGKGLYRASAAISGHQISARLVSFTFRDFRISLAVRED